MAHLAILWHPERGGEVIEILEMLGGKNRYWWNGDDEASYYCVDTDYDREENVIIPIEDGIPNYIYITLEDFLEKYPYKVGDKVKCDYYPCTVQEICWDSKFREVRYTVKGVDFCKYCSANDLKPYKEEITEEKGTLVQIDLTRELCIADEVEVILGDYEFVLKDGKTYFVKKKPQYPKTYEECRTIINAPEEEIRFGYKSRLLSNLQQLLICRDAYWEIAGDWKPSKDNLYEDLYCIGFNGVVFTFKMQGGHKLLSFPTKEMRDAFYENFKVLITDCKEFL